MIEINKLSKVKSTVITTCLQGNYRDSLGEFSTMSYGVSRAESVRVMNNILFS